MATYRRLTQDERLAAHKAALGDDPNAAREGRAALLEDVSGLLTRFAEDRPPPPGVDWDDYLQEFRLTVLTRCVRDWEPDKGAWSTYVYWQLRGCRSRIIARLRNRPIYFDDHEGFDIAEPTPDAPGWAESVNTGPLREALDGLPKRDAAVLRLRFGLGGDDPLTLTQVGDQLGVTKERVRQLEIRALDRLRPVFGVKPLRYPPKLCVDCGAAVHACGNRDKALAGLVLCKEHYHARKAALYASKQPPRKAQSRCPGIRQHGPGGCWSAKVGRWYLGTHPTYEAALAARERFLATGGRETA